MPPASGLEVPCKSTPSTLPCTTWRFPASVDARARRAHDEVSLRRGGAAHGEAPGRGVQLDAARLGSDRYAIHVCANAIAQDDIAESLRHGNRGDQPAGNQVPVLRPAAADAVELSLLAEDGCEPVAEHHLPGGVEAEAIPHHLVEADAEIQHRDGVSRAGYGITFHQVVVGALHADADSSQRDYLGSGDIQANGVSDDLVAVGHTVQQNRLKIGAGHQVAFVRVTPAHRVVARVVDHEYFIGSRQDGRALQVCADGIPLNPVVRGCLIQQFSDPCQSHSSPWATRCRCGSRKRRYAARLPGPRIAPRSTYTGPAPGYCRQSDCHIPPAHPDTMLAPESPS